ncbi:MAG: hypothetical protein ABS70_02235 [Nitrospira sp. SCN 59-13]|nr:MAG: hypothetical protein ABS70_02235 [Nitrospira sp. SCN 59-13]
MSILVVGGDSVDGINERAQAGGHGCVEHWSGRRTRDLVKAIPKKTTAVVVVLDRVNHTLARKVRAEATRRGLPVFFRKRGNHVQSTAKRPLDLTHWINNAQ